MPGGEAEPGQKAALAIRVVTETRNLRTQPFVVPDETNRVGKKESRGNSERFESQLEKNLLDSEIADVFLKLRTKSNDHFTPKKNKHHARNVVLKMSPHLYVGETTSAYAARLREKAKECESGTTF